MRRQLKCLCKCAALTLVIFSGGCSAIFSGSGFGNSSAVQLQESSYTYSGTADTFVAGDGLRITIHPDTAHFLNGTYPIDLGGYVFLPLVGKFQVTGMSVSQFSEFLQGTFAQYLRFPEIQVTPLIRVTMLGGFARAGLYYIEPDHSLWELVYMAGGPSHEEGLRKMKWERDKNTLASNLTIHCQSGHSLRALGIKSGDRISTPADPTRTFWSGFLRDTLIRDVLPVATFFLSLYVTMLR
ncbi:MAG: polysaccharide biosynthesis/export family protein [Chitinispirillales bacterium]|jgi:protein involved in polysaccharide export with SLBB domain|nr:polysaccharide biosynthesis/export family protein [Chitinispirillales bacterium]